MAFVEHYYTQFTAGDFFHIYNRGIDKKSIFKSRSNYAYFLRQWNKYLDGYLDVIAYSLNDNHFHFLVQVNHFTEEELEGKTVHQLISNRLKKFFQSYTMAFNKQHGRVGTLFQTPFKRVCIAKPEDLSTLISYIHVNPQKHGLIDNFRQWEWSSFGRILQFKKSFVKRDFVLEWFGGRKQFIDFHFREFKETDILLLTDE
ncbi:transposase [Aquirufa sp. Wall-65K1]